MGQILLGTLRGIVETTVCPKCRAWAYWNGKFYVCEKCGFQTRH